MTSVVVDLATRRALRDPHREGSAKCLQCQYEWQAVAPIGTTELECPTCGLMKGAFRYTVQTEHPQWECKCGSFVFYIDQHSPYCANCGIRPSF